MRMQFQKLRKGWKEEIVHAESTDTGTQVVFAGKDLINNLRRGGDSAKSFTGDEELFIPVWLHARGEV